MSATATHTTITVTQPQRSIDKVQPPAAWKPYQKYFFRTFFIFFILLCIPFDPGYYALWFTTDWAHLHIRDIGSLSGRGVNFLRLSSESGEFGIGSYVNWFISFGIGLIGALIWGLFERKTTNYRKLYYFLSALVSYTMLIRLNGLTFSKVFPSQMPELAVTQLNTPLGDFTAQKLYWLQFSFVHGYERFAGCAELLIMLLLFFRQTRAWGAALALAMVGNIALANHAYDGGVHVLAMFYAIGGIFVLWRYLPGIYALLVREKNANGKVYEYPFTKKWQQYLRIAFKTFVFVFFFGVSAYCHWQNYKYDSYKVPARPGLANARGLYNVTEFRLNNKVIPYSPVDSVRWQTVTFEKWSTLSFTVFKPFMIHNEAGRGKQFKDVDRTYESAGTGGGRRHYYYEEDSAKHQLVLYNKNKVYKDEKLFLNYQRPSESRIILSGVNESKDSIYIILDKQAKKYPLYDQY
jgi:hypothetical protein